MAKKATTTEPDARAILASLSQTDVAWLVGKPSSWVRDRNHLFERTNGRYDARQVLAALSGEFAAAQLADDQLEPLSHFCDDVAYFAVNRCSAAIQLLESIEHRHGAAGLAAVAVQLLAVLREHAELSHDEVLPAPEEIRRRAEEEIDRLAFLDAKNNYKRLLVCDTCHRFRWGSQWKRGPIPSGYATVGEVICPECEPVRSRRRKRSLEDEDE